MDIIRSNEFQKECSIFKTTKGNLKKRVDNIKEIVESNTKKEKADLEKSIQNYNKKIKTILESDQVKSQTDQIKKEEKQMFLSMNKVMDIYNQARDIIMKDQSIDNETRYKYLSSLEDKMLDKLYDKQEKEHFKRLVSNMIIMIPGNMTPGRNNNMITQGGPQHGGNRSNRDPYMNNMNNMDNINQHRGNINRY